ncbi:hypothetical protein CBR_g3015 [Chara braunii]|uniref:Core Histone H2A/H2B/H3 domain-containing protein n=1 Tax=Chara braunii TaxID=69332 RepID=A0A388KEI9_CHABU|nr:hypothetical protein CBR_g3015 [Chara braunii]|eukprot:GBG68470.1 hypothetical protein CBR_g3015 [Chara braunii]
METEDSLKGFADGSKEGNSAGGNSADCAEVLATICAQTAEMVGDGDETENDAGGSTCETETVGEEREEGGLGSRESLTACIVKDENVVKTSAGEEYPYDINWVPGHVQPVIVGGAPCFAFKVEGSWVPFPAPKKNTWRNVTLAIVFDRLLRLNDEAMTEVKARYAMDVWHVLEAQGEFRLNEFLYDSFDCEKAWVISGNDATGGTMCHESDARRDPMWGWVPCVIPIPCGRVRMMMRDAMGNVWSTHYVNGNFSFRHLDREVLEDEKKAMTCNTHNAGCFFPPLRNPVDSEVVEGKVFTEKIREEERQMVCAGYDSMADQGMRSMVEGSCMAQEHGDGENRYMASIRRRHGCTTVLGWVPVVCPMTYEHGEDVTMRFRDPLGVPFHLTYSNGLLRDIRYMSEDGLPSSTQADKRTKKRSEIFRLFVEVEGPCGTGRVGGCSAAQGDMGGPSDVAMSQSPGKKKKCTPGPPRGQTPAGRKKVNPKAVPGTGDTAGARTQVPRRRRRPGMTTLSEIRKLQRSTDLCLAFGPFLRLVREVVERDIAPGMGVRFQMTAVRALMEVAEAYLVANFENTNEVAIHSNRVTIEVRDMRQREEDERQTIRIISMSVAQVEAALAEVMKYAKEGVHYNGDSKLSLLQDRVPRQGGTYTPANLSKLLGTVARNGGMLVDGSKELKSGTAEILVLSRMKDITQTPPQDFQDVPVIVADGVEYILLDQLVDFMKKSDDDRNVIHEALHEVTEFALQGQDLIEFVPAITEDNIKSGRPLWGELLSAALEQLGLESCDVERQREREEGWKVMATETNLAIISDNGQTSAPQESITSMAVDVPPMQTTTREQLVCCHIFNAFTMEKEQCDRGFEEAVLPSCCAEYTDSAEEEDEEEDEGASSSDVEVSGSDVSSDEEDEKHDVYYDLKAAGGQVTKGWAHAILRLARVFPDPHKVLRVVMKGATPDGALQYVAVTSIMKSCNEEKKWSRVGKEWFVLVNREVVLATSLTWGVNLSCLIHGAMVTAWGETLHPGLSTGDAIKMDNGPRVCDSGRTFMSFRTLNSHRARAYPAVADERTHGQEMGVVDDAGASNIGAVNLVSDESEDVGAPENVDGEGGTFEEQQPQPIESFDSSRKLAALIFFARGGVGFVTTIKGKLGKYQPSTWKLPKLHDLMHLTTCIERSGVPDTFAADVWEHHHRKFCKQPYLSSNKRKASTHMVNHVRRSLALREEIGIVRKRRKRTVENRSSVTDYIATGMNTLALRDTAMLQLRWFDIDDEYIHEGEGIDNHACKILEELPCRHDIRAALTTYMVENGCQPPSDDLLIHTWTHLAIACVQDGIGAYLFKLQERRHSSMEDQCAVTSQLEQTTNAHGLHQ